MKLREHPGLQNSRLSYTYSLLLGRYPFSDFSRGKKVSSTVFPYLFGLEMLKFLFLASDKAIICNRMQKSLTKELKGQLKEIICLLSKPFYITYQSQRNIWISKLSQLKLWEKCIQECSVWCAYLPYKVAFCPVHLPYTPSISVPLKLSSFKVIRKFACLM